MATLPLGLAEVRRALAEDRAREDVTTPLLAARALLPAIGRFVAQERCVVAGLPIAGLAFRELDPGAWFQPCVDEGGWADPGTTLATVRATAAALLGAERTARNFLQRLSAIATVTRRAVEAVAGTGAIVTDTRKTTPGLRALEKYAVRVGGGVNHRASLADAVLFKDNHWALLGTGRLSHALARAPAGVDVIVEVETPEQMDQALAAGVRRILVDNQPPERIAQWVKRAGPGVAIEASGGITLANVRAYSQAGASSVSMGALTHSVGAVGIR
ncbi:MAG: carboxylating nicotinate-nucleotide diphosphorylase, partial [Gemmatimonadetes bacterium]|nr:carboxylating nicotinate-nucleotide diphosphorylase [Gemmatimonadota bacterium]